MTFDYLEGNKELVDSFSRGVKEEEMEDITWILRYIKIATKLHKNSNAIGVEDAKGIDDGLKK